MAPKKTTTRKASKKTTTRRASKKPTRASKKHRKLKELRELTRKARGEVAELLASAQAGSITPEELKTELVRLDEHLEQMEIFEHDL
jgi:hypothetical protein